MFATVILHLLLIFSLPAKGEDERRTVINNPSIGYRCRILVERRQEKIIYKQRLTALLLRNEKLQKRAPLERKTLLRKLRKNRRHLKNELRLALLQIRNQEEAAIRKGCPGIVL